MLTDTIAALATPPGRGALAVLRLSGHDAFAVASRVIDRFRPAPARRATLATFRHPDTSEPIDRGLYTIFPGPGSYTGHDLVELSCHGGLAVPAQLLAALQAAGARQAVAGEFTRRALLNGKLDLVQAEAVGDLIEATAPAQTRSALSRLDGTLSSHFALLREQLVGAQALLAYSIDFPEEDEPPVPPARIRAEVAAVKDSVSALLRTAPAGERLREGALLVLAGRPNAGKSSLFNALLGHDRALVTEVPGTTRDAIEAATSFDGWPVRLLDTAGLWDATERLDRMGVEVSRRWLDAADLVLLCVEAGRDPGEDEREILERGRALLVRTKADLAPWPAHQIAVSTVTRQGLDELRRESARRVFADAAGRSNLELVVTRERHRQALARAHDELEAAMGHLGAGADPVLAAHHLRTATEALDEIVGRVDIDQVLDRVFGSFCIGK